MPDLNEHVCELLHSLLDRYEQPNRQRVVRVRLNAQQHKAYFSTENVNPRHSANQALRHLAEAGIVRLQWRKWEENNWLEAIDLVPEQAGQLYQLLKRHPLNQQDHALRQLLAAGTALADWHSAFLAWAHKQIDEHRSVAPLNRADPQLNQDLLRALAAIASLPAPILERSLSIRLFGDSKRLETLRSAIVGILRRHDPQASTFGDDDWALLRAHHLDRTPEYVPLAGPLVLRQRDASLVDISHFSPSVALSAAMLRESTMIDCQARSVVTVENMTSFNELLGVRPPDTLAIYTGGFASPTVIQLLRAIRTARPDLVFHHWGDLDAGGLRILLHLREQLGEIRPLAMNPQIFAEYRAFSQPLSNSDRNNLQALRQHSALADCYALIDTLLEANQKLEQEAVDIATVLHLVAHTS